MKTQVRSVLLLILSVIFCCGVALAQKGTAEPGYYPVGYHGDTWTGEVTAIDESANQITLTYRKGDKTETFVGTFTEKFVMTGMANNPTGTNLKAKDIPLGTRLTIYYIKKSKKVDGEKVKINEIIGIKVLPKEKPKKSEQKPDKNKQP